MSIRSAFLILALAAIPAGCATPPAPSASASASPVAPDAASELWDMPDMRRAQRHRDRGAALLERAYAVKPGLSRETRFDEAEKELVLAEQAYHDALAQAALPHKPVIEREIAQVENYLFQIRQDRSGPR